MLLIKSSSMFDSRRRDVSIVVQSRRAIKCRTSLVGRCLADALHPIDADSNRTRPLHRVNYCTYRQTGAMAWIHFHTRISIQGLQSWKRPTAAVKASEGCLGLEWQSPDVVSWHWKSRGVKDYFGVWRFQRLDKLFKKDIQTQVLDIFTPLSGRIMVKNRF